MNFYPRFLGDYMRDTMHLSLVEHGAYSLMLDTYYATERPLPADHESLYRICRAMHRAEQEAVRLVADQFFPVHGDGLRHNRRADIEIIRASKRIEIAHENGKRGGRPKNQEVTQPVTQPVTQQVTQQVTKKKPSGLSEHNPTETQRVTQQEPSGKAHHNHNHIPEPQPSPPTASGGSKSPPAGGIAFVRYAEAFSKRYSAEPVRNAKINALFAQLVKRLGAEEAPQVAEFYVFHNNALYVRSGHAVDLLVRDAEKLRTEWTTGKRITDTGARQLDRKQNNLSIAQELIAEQRAANAK